MLENSNVMAFVATTKPVEAKAFYAETLGLRELEDTLVAIVLEANGIELRIQKVKVMTPAEYTVLGWEIEDIRATVQTLLDSGVTAEKFAGLSQDSLGIWNAPGGAKVAWFKDPDGNLLSLTERVAPN